MIKAKNNPKLIPILKAFTTFKPLHSSIVKELKVGGNTIQTCTEGVTTSKLCVVRPQDTFKNETCQPWSLFYFTTKALSKESKKSKKDVDSESALDTVKSALGSMNA